VSVHLRSLPLIFLYEAYEITLPFVAFSAPVVGNEGCLVKIFNLGCLHPVARVISYDVGFNPSTQLHYRRLIYYLYIHSYMLIRCQLSSPKVVIYFSA
jgi:hypothetical protein